MTPVTSEQMAVLAQQRAELDAERRLIQKAHCLAVLDHVAAKVRQACPEAAYIGVAYDGKTRELDLLGVLGEQTSPLGGLPWVWEASDEEHPLAELAIEIEADVETALEPYDSPAWATVRRNSASDGNLWLVELPPLDRAARIAQLVREHHPVATAVVIDGRRGGRIIEVFEGVADNGTPVRAPRPKWPAACDTVLTRLLGQVLALPALADRHLMPLPGDYAHPYGVSTSDQVRLMPLPPTA
ncbi:hypothetical protein [Streptomyces sp. NBC_00557]|uniref:hypothetical protein n=1 Tax=Streptomyces sp. NBC_00557 TaxID=2975776 RepID=UPI002E81E98A|nr:hypothetical protein [Streptomyces sp. NBC_00557]WUC37196.1 hypothetical protein OG956_24780 [Streptomyces sp. NBC_00557]